LKTYYLKILTLFLILLSLTGGIAYIVLKLDKTQEKFNEKLFEVASQLESYGLYEKAYQHYNEYLKSRKVPLIKKANIYYLMGKIAMDYLKDYERAVDAFVLARTFGIKGIALKNLNERLIECLENLGKSNTAQNELKKATALNKEEIEDVPQEGAVVAKIEDREVRAGELEEMLNSLPEFVKSKFKTKKFKKQFLRDYVAKLLIIRAARRAGYLKKKNIRHLILQARNQILFNAYYKNEIANKIIISPEEAKLYYKANKEKFSIPAKHTFRIIVVKKEKEANELLNNLKKNKYKNFKSLAAKFNIIEELKNTKGLLPPKNHNEKIKFIEDESLTEALYRIKEGEVAGPFKIKDGFIIIKVEKIKPAILKKFEEVKGQVISELKIKKEREMYTKIINNLINKENVRFYDEAL